MKPGTGGGSPISSTGSLWRSFSGTILRVNLPRNMPINARANVNKATAIGAMRLYDPKKAKTAQSGEEYPLRANSARQRLTERYKNAAQAKSFRQLSPTEQLVALFATTGLKTCSCRLDRRRNQRDTPH